MKSKRILIKRAISSRTGSEGPHWDPYSYTEYFVSQKWKLDDHIIMIDVVMHGGLSEWLSYGISVDGVNVENKKDTHFENYEDMIRRFEIVTGMTFAQVEDQIHRDRNPPRKCPSCGSRKFEDSSGFVGETVMICAKCRDIVWMEEVTLSMIE
jgi:hypothetical protein